MGFFKDFLWEDTRFSLDDALEIVEHDYPDDFEDRFCLKNTSLPSDSDLHPDDWQEYRRLKQFSDRLAVAVQALIRSKLPEAEFKKLDELEFSAKEKDDIANRLYHELKDVVEKPFKLFAFLMHPSTEDPRSKRAFFQSCMQLHAWKLFYQSPGKMAERMLKLVQFLVKAPGLGTQLYLRRVAECYIRDMHPELAVMTRAVLEKALSDALPEEIVRREEGLRDNERVTLSKWINAARRHDLLDQGSEDAAKRIRTIGNEAVHLVPESTPDPDTVLQDLVLVIETLQERSSRDH